MTRAAKIDAPATSPDTDFHAWAFQTAEAIHARRFAGIDWDAVAEEVEEWLVILRACPERGTADP